MPAGTNLFLNNRQVGSNFFYCKLLISFMFTQENDLVEAFAKWAQSIGINLDRDPEQL